MAGGKIHYREKKARRKKVCEEDTPEVGLLDGLVVFIFEGWAYNFKLWFFSSADGGSLAGVFTVGAREAGGVDCLG